MNLFENSEPPEIEHAKSNEGETRYDDQTLLKVGVAIMKEGYTRDQAFCIMNQILNAGIVFRERV